MRGRGGTLIDRELLFSNLFFQSRKPEYGKD